MLFQDAETSLHQALHPADLLVQFHLRIIQHKGVSGLPERVGFTVGIDIIPFLEVLHHVLQQRMLALHHHFIETTLCADLIPGGHENFQLRIRKNSRSDIASVHHHASLLAKRMQAGVHIRPDKGDGGYRAHVARDFQRADFLFHAAVSDAAAALAEMGIQARKTLLQRGQVDCFIGRYPPVFHREKGYGAIQGTGIQVREPEVFRNQLRERALPRRGIAVDGNDDVRNLPDKIGIG